MRTIAMIGLAAFAAVASTSGSATSLQLTQGAPATDCDTYAAHPLDPERVTAGVPSEKINPDLAIPACENAVRKYQNSARLIFQLGRAYQSKSDFSSALVQFQKSADQGYAAARNNLGIMYADGLGVPQNDAEAVKWFRKAADQGHANAQSALGFAYQAGKLGMPQDYGEAVKWLRKAADQGYAPGQGLLGSMYLNGLGVPQDYGEAVKWYRKAADQGNAHGQQGLAFMYANGLGVPQDYAEAVKWWRKAADQGDANGQQGLAVMYANGRGVPPDYIQAHMWYTLAASRYETTQLSDEMTKSRDRLASFMSSAQIAEAQRLAQECIQNNYKECGVSKPPNGSP